jgi:hypothetical protein
MIAKTWGNDVVAPIAMCISCNTIWEPWPEDTPEDVVEREPCDNCAYRRTSSEGRDPDQRENLIESARQAGFLMGEAPCSIFQCHKGMPIRLSVTPPQIRFDPDAAGIGPLDQTCLGFLRVIWAQDRKVREFLR